MWRRHVETSRVDIVCRRRVLTSCGDVTWIRRVYVHVMCRHRVRVDVICKRRADTLRVDVVYRRRV